MWRAPLLQRIERYLKKTGTSPTRFGRETVRDPCLISDMRSGRHPRRRVERRITDWLDAREREAEAGECPR